MPLPCPADTCLMYLLRHAATENNLCNPPRLQGSGTDSPLSEQGRAEAEATAAFLADRPIERIYTSPLLRARTTAEFVAAPHGLSCEVLPEVIEADVGQWEGRDWGEIERNEPEAYRLYMQDPGTYPYAGGESFGDVARRVVPAIDALMQQNLGRQIVLVGHNGVNRCYLATRMNIPLATSREITQSNCGINVIRLRRGKFNVRTMNAAFHLPLATLL